MYNNKKLYCNTLIILTVINSNFTGIYWQLFKVCKM